MNHSPPRAPVKADVMLEHGVALRLFGTPDAPGRRLVEAVRPLRLHFSQAPGGVSVEGDQPAIELARRAIDGLVKKAASGQLDEAAVRAITSQAIADALKHDLAYRLPGLPHAVRPMTLSQVAFMEALLHGESPLVFGVGPTGTGKTHLAIAAGLNLVAEGRFKSLVLTRPHVLLEGEVMTPVSRAETGADDQLTPLEDVLQELIGHDELQRRLEHGQIQILPLGRLRGRTFNEAFIVLDEAQNMTVKKMRMAVTRLGRGSRMAIIGDPAQIDLAADEPSGLAHLMKLLAGADLAETCRFELSEIIRNDAVARIEALYAGEGKAGLRPAA